MKSESIAPRQFRVAIGRVFLVAGNVKKSESPNFEPQTFLLKPGGQDYVGVNSYDSHVDLSPLSYMPAH